tara:strand:- start:472 stop:1392 length:921 start_codon:yes stop_codon:yes gene_type:complete
MDFFFEELKEGRLRQGWGFDPGQDLRDFTVDKKAKPNLSIFNSVKKGDILVIPRLPTWDEVMLAEATEDFNQGYQYQIDSERGDFGHIFPAKIIKSFDRHHALVQGDLRKTLRQRPRFWNANHCQETIDSLIQTSETLDSSLPASYRFEHALHKTFVETDFSEAFSREMMKHLSNEEWEYALVSCLESILPKPICVERVGGRQEEEHGTDILIRLPGLLDKQYGIAIQVKDYQGVMSEDAIEQIRKADAYWNQENLILVDKYIIVTGCHKEDQTTAIQQVEDVTILYGQDLQRLLQESVKKRFELS